MRKNRRGQEMIVDFWAIIVFAIIILLFIIVFSATKKANESKLETAFESKDANFMLESFLRAPAVGVNPEMTVADIIAEDSMSGDFSRTKTLFESYFKYTTTMNSNDINDILLKIDGEHDKRMKIVTSKGVGGFGKALLLLDMESEDENYSAEAYIPGYGQEYSKKIIIKLRLSAQVSDDT